MVLQWSPLQSPPAMALAQHLDGDQQRVQSGGLLWGGHGLAAGLQLADGNPADALEGLVGLHLLQGDDEDVTLFVFDGFKEDLPKVLDPEQPLHDGMRTATESRVSGDILEAQCSVGLGSWDVTGSCLLETSLPHKAPTESPQPIHVSLPRSLTPHRPTTRVLPERTRQGHPVLLLTEPWAGLAEPGVFLGAALPLAAPKAAWPTEPPHQVLTPPPGPPSPAFVRWQAAS